MTLPASLEPPGTYSFYANTMPGIESRRGSKFKYYAKPTVLGLRETFHRDKSHRPTGKLTVGCYYNNPLVSGYVRPKNPPRRCLEGFERLMISQGLRRSRELEKNREMKGWDSERESVETDGKSDVENGDLRSDSSEPTVDVTEAASLAKPIESSLASIEDDNHCTSEALAPATPDTKSTTTPSTESTIEKHKRGLMGYNLGETTQDVLIMFPPSIQGLIWEIEQISKPLKYNGKIYWQTYWHIYFENEDVMKDVLERAPLRWKVKEGRKEDDQSPRLCELYAPPAALYHHTPTTMKGEDEKRLNALAASFCPASTIAGEDGCGNDESHPTLSLPPTSIPDIYNVLEYSESVVAESKARFKLLTAPLDVQKPPTQLEVAKLDETKQLSNPTIPPQLLPELVELDEPILAGDAMSPPPQQLLPELVELDEPILAGDAMSPPQQHLFNLVELSEISSIIHTAPTSNPPGIVNLEEEALLLDFDEREFPDILSPTLISQNPVSGGLTLGDWAKDLEGLEWAVDEPVMGAVEIEEAGQEAKMAEEERKVIGGIDGEGNMIEGSETGGVGRIGDGDGDWELAQFEGAVATAHEEWVQSSQQVVEFQPPHSQQPLTPDEQEEDMILNETIVERNEAAAADDFRMNEATAEPLQIYINDNNRANVNLDPASDDPGKAIVADVDGWEDVSGNSKTRKERDTGSRVKRAEKKGGKRVFRAGACRV